MTLRDAMERFFAYLLSEKGDSRRTVEAYEGDLRQFQDLIGEKPAEELGLSDYDDYLAFLTSKGYSKTSLVRKAMAVKGFYRFLKGENVLRVTLGEMEVPKKGRSLPRVLTDREVRLLFQSQEAETFKGLLNLTMMEVCYSCGLRVSELCNLKLGQVNVPDGYLKIRGKGDKERIVPMNQECRFYLSEYLDRRKGLKTKERNLFLHEDRGRVSRQYFYLELRKAAEKAGLGSDVHPHMLRHSFATTLLENGAPIRQVQELLGHSQVETTMIYTKVSSKMKREGYDKAMGEGED